MPKTTRNLFIVRFSPPLGFGGSTALSGDPLFYESLRKNPARGRQAGTIDHNTSLSLAEL
jgi:hypothetical protein